MHSSLLSSSHSSEHAQALSEVPAQNRDLGLSHEQMQLLVSNCWSQMSAWKMGFVSSLKVLVYGKRQWFSFRALAVCSLCG